MNHHDQRRTRSRAVALGLLAAGIAGWTAVAAAPAAASTTASYLIQMKSYIGPVNTSEAPPPGGNGPAYSVLLNLTNAAYQENPPDGTQQSGQYRMWGQYHLTVTCDGTDNLSWTIDSVQTAAGAEGYLWHGEVDPLLVQPTKSTAAKLKVRAFLTGHPNQLFEPDFQAVLPRSTRDIFQFNELNVSCLDGAPRWDSLATNGSAFPSHKTWLTLLGTGNPPIVVARAQGPMSELWRLPPARLRAFEQTSADATTNGRTRQVALSDDGKYRWIREFDAGAFGGWSGWWREPNTTLQAPADAIRSYSHNANPAGQWKEDALDANGATLYSRVHNGGWGPWQSIGTSQLMGNLESNLQSFEHQQADASGPATQTAVGWTGTIYTRTYSTTWSGWSVRPISGYGLPANVPGIRSISHSLRPLPGYEPKEDVVNDAGQLILSRTYPGGWTGWVTISVIDLGIPATWWP